MRNFFYVATLFIPNPSGGLQQISFNSSGAPGILDNTNPIQTQGVFKPVTFEITRSVENKTFELELTFDEDSPINIRTYLNNSRLVSEIGFRYDLIRDGVRRTLFYGVLNKVKLSNRKAYLTIDSVLNRLQYTKVFKTSSNCRWKFGDPLTCGFDRSTLEQSLTIDVISVDRLSFTTTTAMGAGDFRDGAVKYGNLEAEFDVSINTTDTILLWDEIPEFITSGTTIIITPGCRKTEIECKNTYNNFARFGGTPSGTNWMLSTMQSISGSKSIS